MELKDKIYFELNGGTLYKSDCIEVMKKLEDSSLDIIYCDPPYALGSDTIIRPDGKPDYNKATDFMNKWEQPGGDFWEEWFKETYRLLKYGGRVIMFGMDRQLLLYKYYAVAVGFSERQSLYWYFIQNFPKATDLSKSIDKNFGAEREIVGVDKDKLRPNRKSEKEGGTRVLAGGLSSDNGATITTPATDLAKKYSGYKYSISPLKQTNETIMIFQKPYLTGSCLHDVLAYENGENKCLCGAVDIDGGRVLGGRYPAQTFIQCICEESVTKENPNQPYSYKGREYNNKDTSMFNGDKPQAPSNYNDKNSGQIHTNPNCFDTETEIFTKDGWKGYNTIKENDLCASLNPKTREFEWSKIKSVICYAYNDIAYEIESRDISLIATPKHQQIIYARWKKEGKFVDVENLLKRKWDYYIPRGCEWRGQEKEKILIGNAEYNVLDLCELLGWYFSEGCCVKHQRQKNYVMEIWQNEGYKMEEIYRCAKKITERTTKLKKCIQIRDFNLANYLKDFGKKEMKYLPEFISEQAPVAIKKFIYSYIEGDGHREGGFSNIYTGSRKIATQLVELLLKAGYSTRYYLQRPKGSVVFNQYKTNSDIWSISVKKFTKTHLKSIHSKKIIYKGVMWDVFLEINHTVLVRRKNKIFWTGNCPCAILDAQSGVLTSGDVTPHKQSLGDAPFQKNTSKQTINSFKGDTVGCSKILHKCRFEEDEHTLYFYQPKVSKQERNAGCEVLEKKQVAYGNQQTAQLNRGEDLTSNAGVGNGGVIAPQHNNHPTLKPVSLNEKILILFKTPNPQKILYPFAGVGSEVIGGTKAGFTDWVGCELNEEYCKIAEARIKHWMSKPKQEKLF